LRLLGPRGPAGRGDRAHRRAGDCRRAGVRRRGAAAHRSLRGGRSTPRASGRLSMAHDEAAARAPARSVPASLDVALVKTSSLGDVIHALPVVTDILAACPAARIDWVVEESFAELPALHPGVATIHRVAMRRWRKAPLAATTRAEWARFRAGFRARRYDLILDLQGLPK